MKKHAFSNKLVNRAVKPSVAADRLLAATIMLLREFSPDEVTISMVLTKAKVARNTLYLHYENRTALIEAALLSVFLDGAKNHADLLMKSANESLKKHDFIEQAIKLVKSSQDREFKNVRIARCRLIAHADKNARFSRILSMEQSKLNENFARSFETLQRKGWMSRKVSPEAAALFVQAMTFGRVLDDVSSKKINEKSWDEAFIFIMKKTILDD
jgi:AcrR family transcriptional regulator